MIYIIGTTSESNNLINSSQDILKKNGATYNSTMRKWCWWLSGDEEELKKQIAAYVYPCIKEISAQEVIQTGGDLETNIENYMKFLNSPCNIPVMQCYTLKVGESGTVPVLFEARLQHFI